MDRFLQLFLLFFTLGVTMAWIGRYEPKQYAWAPSRRSAYCVKTGVQCLQSSQCCSLRDVCLTNAKYSIYASKSPSNIPASMSYFGLCTTEHRYSTCENVEALAASRYVKPHKKAGEECRDSLECLDLCCREYRGHRFHLNRCGKSEDDFTSYTCVMAPPKTGNDVLDDEIGLK